MFVEAVSSLIEALGLDDQIRLSSSPPVSKLWKVPSPDHPASSRKASTTVKFSSPKSDYSSWSQLNSDQKSVSNSNLHLRDHDTLPEYTLDQVSDHCTSDDCWIVIFDKVYDVTEFLHEHPGGEFIICEHAGHDATIAFQNSLHGKDAYDLMKKYCIGVLIKEQRLYTMRPSEYSVGYRGP